MPKSKVQKKESVTSIMTKPSEEQEVSIWKSRVALGVEQQRKHYKENADKWRKFYEGDHWPDSRYYMKEERLVVNYTYAIVKSIVPQIYFQDPHFYLSPFTKEWVDNRELAELALNQKWRAIQMKQQIKKIVLDHLVTSYGVGKMGYHTKFVRGKGSENMETGMDYTEYIQEEYPFFIRHSPEDIIFDTERTDFDTIRWYALRYLLPIHDVKKDYNNAEKLNGEQYFSKDFVNSRLTLDEEIAGDFDRIEVWEIHDMVDMKRMTIAGEAEKFLSKEDNEYGFNNCRVFSVNNVPDKLYPLSEISQIADLNWELDKARTQLARQRAKAGRKILVEEGAFATPADKDKFLNGEDMQMVVLSDGALKEQKVFVVSASSISPDLYMTAEEIVHDINNVSAVGYQQRSAESPTEKTATEVNVMDKNANLRNSERLDVMEDYVISLARDLLKIMQTFPDSDEELYLEHTGENVTWNPEKIAGRYNLRINVGTTARRDVETERTVLMQMLPQINNMVDGQTGKPVINTREFLRVLLKHYAFTDDQIDRIITEPIPEEPPPSEEQAAPGGLDVNLISDLLAQSGYGTPGVGGIDNPMSTIGMPGMEGVF